MGQDIDRTHFKKIDFNHFKNRLSKETEILKQYFADNAFEDSKTVAGYELETCLTDQNGSPSPSNEKVLQEVQNPEIVAELAQYNLEVNGPPRTISANVFSQMESDISTRCLEVNKAVDSLGLKMLSIGILPTLKNDHLGLASMSKAKRYRALNEQVLRLRQGEPIHLNLAGEEKLKLDHQDVMLEAAATSFQIHLQLSPKQMPHFYNLSKIISAPMVAVSANSPYLFGKELWEESRIPLFEQAVSVGGTDYCRRVTFGVRYLEGSIFDVFEANQERYPILLPLMMDSPEEKLKHLNLHNGTIWRWTRPIVGFNEDGKPNLRIEHRTVPAGPTLIDQTANMAFFIGLIWELADQKDWIYRIPHEVSQSNFYKAARYGMHTKIKWLDGNKVDLRKLCLEELIPKAKKGLAKLNINKEESENYINIIKERLKSAQTGANWQKKWIAKHGRDWNGLTLAYLEKQNTNQAVHTWNL